MKRPRVLFVTVLIAVLVGIPAVLGALAVSADQAFQNRADRLQARWAHDQQVGVPQAAVDPLRAQLAKAHSQHQAFSLPGGNPEQPLAQLEAESTQVEVAALDDSRAKAKPVLDERNGQDPQGAEGRAKLLAQASTPAQVSALSAGWQQEIKAANLDQQLDGAVGKLAVLSERAQKDGVSTQPITDAQSQVAAYHKLSTDQRVAQGPELLKALQASYDSLSALLPAVEAASAAIEQARSDLSLAQAFGDNVGDDQAKIEAAQSALKSADSADKAKAAQDQAQSAADHLEGLLSGPATQFNATACIKGAPDYLIVVNLPRQQMVAYDHGCPHFSSYVTTGERALRTDTGVFHIFYKSAPYKFISPWPLGSPFYYPPTWVGWAMQFVPDGTFLHDAPWEPDSVMGPGSENGPYASHGCVHIPLSLMPQLYAWAPMGTEVIVQGPA